MVLDYTFIFAIIIKDFDFLIGQAQEVHTLTFWITSDLILILDSPWNIQLHWTTFKHSIVESPISEFRHTFW